MKNAGDSEELGRKDDLTAKEAGCTPASFIYVSRLEQDSLLQLDITTATCHQENAQHVSGRA